MSIWFLELPFVANRNENIDAYLVLYSENSYKGKSCFSTTICCGIIRLRNHNIWWWLLALQKLRFFKSQTSGLVNDPVTEAAHEGRNEGRSEGRNEAINEAVNGAANGAVNDTVNCRQISFTPLSRHHPVTLPPVGGITVGIKIWHLGGAWESHFCYQVRTKMITELSIENAALSLFPAFKILSGWISADEKMRLPFCDGRRIVIQI